MNKEDIKQNSYVLETFIDVRTVAQALLTCQEQGLDIHSSSELGRQCIAAIAARSKVQIASVQDAIAILSESGFSMTQFRRRGNKIKNALIYEDKGIPAEVQERASEIAHYIESLNSNEHDSARGSRKAEK